MDARLPPEVHRPMPRPVRVLLIAAGAACIGLPLWELGPGLWPLTIATPVFALIVGGAMTIGSLFIVAGVQGEGQRWAFPPGAIVIHRTRWRSERETRLAARDIVAIEVRRSENSEGPDTWRVVLVPTLQVPIDDAPLLSRASMFATGDYATQALADEVRERLVAHLRWPTG